MGRTALRRGLLGNQIYDTSEVKSMMFVKLTTLTERLFLVDMMQMTLFFVLGHQMGRLGQDLV